MGSVIPQHDQINGTPGHIYGHCSRRIQLYMFYEETKVSSTRQQRSVLRGNKGQFYAALSSSTELQDKSMDFVAGVSMFYEVTKISSMQNHQVH